MMRRVSERRRRRVIHLRRPAVMHIPPVHHFGVLGGRVHRTRQLAVRMAVRVPGWVARGRWIAVAGAPSHSEMLWRRRRRDGEAAQRMRQATRPRLALRHVLIKRRVDPGRRQRLDIASGTPTRHADRRRPVLRLWSLLPSAKRNLPAVLRRIRFERSFPGRGREREERTVGRRRDVIGALVRVHSLCMQPSEYASRPQEQSATRTRHCWINLWPSLGLPSGFAPTSG